MGGPSGGDQVRIVRLQERCLTAIIALGQASYRDLLKPDREISSTPDQSSTNMASTFWNPRGNLLPRRPRSPR